MGGADDDFSSSDKEIVSNTVDSQQISVLFDKETALALVKPSVDSACMVSSIQVVKVFKNVEKHHRAFHIHTSIGTFWADISRLAWWAAPSSRS